MKLKIRNSCTPVEKPEPVNELYLDAGVDGTIALRVHNEEHHRRHGYDFTILSFKKDGRIVRVGGFNGEPSLGFQLDPDTVGKVKVE